MQKYQVPHNQPQYTTIMKIWFVSDTHGQHSRLQIPLYDLVIHCGDESNSMDAAKNLVETKDFFDWFDHLPGSKIFVPGNHSTAIYKGLFHPNRHTPEGRAPGTQMLVDRLYHGIYGSPWTPTFRGSKWAYTKPRAHIKDVWAQIQNCELLVTHGPPKGILDLAKDYVGAGLVHCGCAGLRRQVLNLKPKIHAFGHIHSDSASDNCGIYENWGIRFINCSVVDNNYTLVNNGYVVDTDILADFPLGKPLV